MRYSKVLGRTLRDIPKAAAGTGYHSLLRAGLIKPFSGGIYALLPIGSRVFDRLGRMVAAEFEKLGAQALTAPPYAPTFRERSSLAEKKRELADCRSQIRQQYFLAPYHEETLATLAGSLGMSYRELPLVVSHSQWRFREESGGGSPLLAARWFPIYGVYAFGGGGTDCAALAEACKAIFRELGLDVVPARIGQTAGATASEEFLVLADAGDESFAVCDGCGAAARFEYAESVFAPFPQNEEPGVKEAMLGEGIVSTIELANFLGIAPEKTTKTMLFSADGRVIAVCVRGEFGISEAKLAEVVGCSSLELAAPDVVEKLTGASVGYAGPVGLAPEVEVIWDLSTEGRINFEAGANRTDYHLVNLNFGRDIAAPARFADIRQAREGELCARCGSGKLVARKGYRLAHVSNLGSMYAKALGATVASKDGKNAAMEIACCGIDLGRLLEAAALKHTDAKGLAWPKALAPFDVHLVSLGDAEARAEAVYECLRCAGIAVLWDDRQGPAGAKFSDADVLGVPVRLVVSPKTGDQIEWKERKSEGVEKLAVDEVIGRLRRAHS